MGILLNKFERKPDPRICFFEINLDFLHLQILQLAFNVCLLFFVMKALTFKLLYHFYILSSTSYIIIHYFLKIYLF